MKKNSRWNCDDEDDGNGKAFLLIRSSMNISTKSTFGCFLCRVHFSMLQYEPHFDLKKKKMCG